ncbi:histidine phosphatase family protein [Hoyosella subflava]|uniref:histidine phosphatase family protein n=1 Tax=Hoyosella subflava TaxID=639313 RepID=UPI00059EC698|nr:histidine phosphatase family protein [Hoyosella subflava]
MTVLLVRHGRSHANTSGLLAGRTAGVSLDERGQEQALSLAGRLASLPIRGIVCSPLLRCQQTVDPLAQKLGLEPLPDTRLLEVDYGDWTGKPLSELVKEPLWAVVQQHPSAVVFPGGESLAQVQSRAVAAIREHDKRLAADGGDGLWVVCTHGDVIKSIVADALGLHLDGFQRIIVEPASISVVRYTETRPFLHHLNDTGADFAHLKPRESGNEGTSDAVVGGDVPR